VRLLAVGTAFPPHYVAQETVARTLAQSWSSNGSGRLPIERLHGVTGVEGRYFSLPIDDYTAPRSFTESNDAFIRIATDLGVNAIEDALTQAAVAARDVGLLVVVTTTGVAAPSLGARLLNRLDLRPDLKHLPVIGLGCVGGAAGVARCSEYVRAFPDELSLMLSVELCSLTLQLEDRSRANMIATGLFGDGAACAVVAGAGRGSQARLRVMGSRSLFHRDTEDVLGWHIGESGFRLLLREDLPQVACKTLRSDVEQFLAAHDLRCEDIGRWIVHPGGPKILRHVQEALGIPPDALSWSYDSLRRRGNVSSVSVLLILRDVIESPPPPGTYGMMLGMGPGFSAELVLLRWE